MKFDRVDARVTNDERKTCLWGMDVMSGCMENGRRVMLPWELKLWG